MRPVIVEWLARFIGYDAAVLLAPTYFTMVALAALAGALVIVRRARRDGDDLPTVLTTLLVGYVAAVVGGIVLPMLFDTVATLAAGRGLRVRWAGMMAYGGLGGALVAVVLYLRRARRLELARFGDLFAPLVGLSVAIVRTGCFVAGCDYGQVTDVAWAVRFPAGSPAWRDHVGAGLVPAWRDTSLPVHPTQLYEALVGVALFLGLSWLARTRVVREGRPGLLLPLALAGYALGRSAVESLRGDASRGFLGPLSTSQAIGVLVLALVGYVLWARLRRGRLARASLAAVLVGLVLVATVPDAHAREWQLGGLYGTTNSFNRKPDQVPQLVGGALALTFDAHAPLTVGAQLEIMSNSVATHQVATIELVFRRPLSKTIDFGVRGGFGYAAVSFHDASFGPLSGLDLRVMGTLDLRVGEAWTLSVWPLAFESLQAPDLGGPILSYQFRIGLSYTFGRPPTPVPVPQLVPPLQPYPPQPYPPQPYPPQPPAPSAPGQDSPERQRPAPPPLAPLPPR